MTEHIVPRTRDAAPRGRRRRRVLTVIAAAALAVLVWLVAVVVVGVDLVVGDGSAAMTIGLAPVVVVPLLAGGAAWGLRAALDRARRGRRVWLIVAWAVLVVSLLGPVSMASSSGAMASLLLMHLVVGLTLIVGLGGRRTGVPSRRTSL